MRFPFKFLFIILPFISSLSTLYAQTAPDSVRELKVAQRYYEFEIQLVNGWGKLLANEKVYVSLIKYNGDDSFSSVKKYSATTDTNGFALIKIPYSEGVGFPFSLGSEKYNLYQYNSIQLSHHVYHPLTESRKFIFRLTVD